MKNGLALGGIIVAAYEATLNGQAAHQFSVKGPVSRWQSATYWWSHLPPTTARTVLATAGWSEAQIAAVVGQAAAA